MAQHLTCTVSFVAILVFGSEGSFGLTLRQEPPSPPPLVNPTKNPSSTNPGGGGKSKPKPTEPSPTAPAPAADPKSGNGGGSDGSGGNASGGGGAGGSDGADGKDGQDGKDGKDGKDGSGNSGAGAQGKDGKDAPGSDNPAKDSAPPSTSDSSEEHDERSTNSGEDSTNNSELGVFSTVFKAYYRSLAVGELPGVPCNSTVFFHNGKYWLCVTTKTLLVENHAATFDATFATTLVGDGSTATLTGLRVDDFRTSPDAPGFALLDISDQSAVLESAQIKVPTLAEAALIESDSFPGTECAVLWRETPNIAEPMRISVTRVETVDESDGLPAVIILDADLAPGTEGAPVLIPSGQLIGICNEPDGASVHSATSASALHVIIEQGVAIGDSDRLAMIIRDWQNQDGLRELCEYLRKKEFDRLLSWRVVELKNGVYVDTFDPAITTPNGPTVIAVLSEAPSDDLALKIEKGVKGVSPRFSGVDNGPDLDAAVKLNDPAALANASRTIEEPSRNSNARVLVLECTAVDKDTDPLPDESMPASETPAAPSPSNAAPSDTPDPTPAAPKPSPIAPSANPNGPAIMLRLHGVVGVDMDGERFFTATDFKVALEKAYAEKPSVIVLDIKSGGGRVDTKEEMLREILTATARGQRFVAVVRDAGSAAALIALACPEIMVYPASRIGAAVTIISNDEETVSFKKFLEADPELAAKYNSYADAMDAEAARATHRSTAIPAAMKDSAAELWWSPTKGFAPAKHSDDATCYDGPSSILTLTYSQIKETGLGKAVVGDDQVWSELGFTTPPKQVDLTPLMFATYDRVVKLFKQYEGNVESVARKAEEELVRLFNQP